GWQDEKNRPILAQAFSEKVLGVQAPRLPSTYDAKTNKIVEGPIDVSKIENLIEMTIQQKAPKLLRNAGIEVPTEQPSTPATAPAAKPVSSSGGTPPAPIIVTE